MSIVLLIQQLLDTCELKSNGTFENCEIKYRVEREMFKYAVRTPSEAEPPNSPFGNSEHLRISFSS